MKLLTFWFKTLLVKCMDADNILRTLTPEEIMELGSAMKSKVEEIYARYWYARDVLLVNAQTKEEIQSITILSD